MPGRWQQRGKKKIAQIAAAQTARVEGEAPGMGAAPGRGHGGEDIHTAAPQAGKYFLRDISCGEPMLQEGTV